MTTFPLPSRLGGKPNPRGSVSPLCDLRQVGETVGVPSVLIVDDHAGFRARARRLLESEGWQVVGEAGGAAEALKAAAELNPEMILLDVHLPDGNGLDVAATLSDQRRASTVVLTSSRDASDFADRLRTTGAAGFVPKAELSGETLAALLP
jgi:DNA-binding NarL/FixJ family response regulator